MLVVKLIAVFHAWCVMTGLKPRLSIRWFCTRWNTYRNSTESTEKARTPRAYALQVCSASGRTPMRR